MQLNTCMHELLRPPYKPNWQPCVLVWEVAIFLWAFALVIPRQERRRACCSGTSAGFSKLARQLGGIKATLSANEDASAVVYVVGGVHSCFAHHRRLRSHCRKHRWLPSGNSDSLTPLFDVPRRISLFAPIVPDELFSSLDVSGLHRHHRCAFATPCDVTNFLNG